MDWREVSHFLSGMGSCIECSSFAELGCAIPLSGGAQAYLAYAYGPMLSYLYTWTAVAVIKPGSSAIISLIFGYVWLYHPLRAVLMPSEYINRMLYHVSTGNDESPVPEWTFKVSSSSIPRLSARVLTLSSLLSLLFS